MGDEEEFGWLVTDTVFITGKLTGNFIALKIPRQCPLVHLVKLVWRQGRRLRSERGKNDGQ
jgi:hypothetical protein